MKSRLILIILAIAGISLLASGCGRKGQLDTPSQAAAKANAQETLETKEKAEDRKFILDGLIE